MRSGTPVEIRCARHSLAPSVSIRVWLRGGLLCEQTGGEALVCGRMLVEGTRHRSWEQIAAEAEALGMDITAFGGPEVIGLGIDALSDDWEQALEWAAELTLDPVFPEDRTAFVVRQTMAEIERLREQGEVIAGWAFLEQLYGEHPWGRPLQGSASSLGELDGERLARFHRGSLARGAIVSVVGDVEPAAAREAAEAAFFTEGSGVPAFDPVPPASLESPRRVGVPLGDQAHLYVGQLTIPLAHEDRIALEVASVCLGSGPGLVGRIPQRVREAEGLAYVTHVGTAAGAGTERGRLIVYLGTGVETVDRAREVVVEELERLVAEGLSEREVEDAVRYLAGSQPFRRETARQIALLHSQACLYHVPVDRPDWLERRLAELDRDRINAAIRRHLDPKRLVHTVGLPRGQG